MKYFTKAQIEEIRKQLATLGVRDTDLPDVTAPLNGDEIVAIVQNGENRKVPIRTLIHDYLPDDIADGADGADGKSAYEIWLEEGHLGSKQDFLNSLKGADGASGAQGPQGPAGPQGEAGPQGPQGPAGSGADVIWNQIISTGTKIAELMIGDAAKIDVKVPNAGVQNVKTINNVAIAGTGNLWAKDLIRSGQDIKTINNQSIVGSGNINISGGSGTPGEPGDDGQSVFKSTIFVRMNNTPTKPAPSDGSYNNPSPSVLAGQNSDGVNVYWSDGIPAGSNVLWASTRIFTSDGELPQQSVWSDPRQMTDVTGYDVEFAPMQTNDATPAIPTYGTGGTRESRGPGNNRNDGLSTYSTYEAAINGGMVWFDPDSDFSLSGIDWTAMVWKAERWYDNGVPGNWIIERIKGERGTTGAPGVSIASMDYLFKGGTSQSFMELPSESTYDTLVKLSAIGWVTNSGSITLDENLPYLWSFMRVEYTDGSITHIGPWCVRYFNQELNIDYEDIAERVISQIDSDLASIKSRLNAIDGPNSTFVQRDGLTQILNEYIRYDDAGSGVATFRGFADAVFNAEEASIKVSAGSEMDSKLQAAGLSINGIASALQAAATKQELSGAVSDARTEWRTADNEVKAAITNTVTKAKYVWYYSVANATYDYNFQNKGDNETFEAYEQRVKNLYGTDPVTGDDNIQLVLIAEEMSAIKQESDNIMLAVGDGQNFSAGIQILKNAQWRDPNGNLITNPNGTPASGSKIILDAQRVEINGELSAGIITANTANIQSIASQAVTTQVIDAVDGRIRNLTVTKLNTAGEGEGASNEKITIYGNNMTVYDSDRKMRVNITADPIDLSPTAIPYPMGTGSLVSLLKNVKFTNGSGSGTLKAIIGEFSVSDNSSSISYPAIYANILSGSTNLSTATITSVWSGILTNDQSSSKVVNFTGALNSELYSISSGEATLNSGNYLVAIEVNYTYSVNQPGQSMFTIDADPLDLDISGYTSLGSVMVVDMSENYVRIGMNGAIFNLGGGFYASFETDPDNQTPAYRRKISLMGASNGVDFGIRITGNGIEKKNLGDSGWTLL